MILFSVTKWISAKAVGVSLVHQGVLRDAFAEVSHFRSELYACLTARGDALFELCDALLCTDGPVRTLVDLALALEYRRGHGALYGGLNQGRIDAARLRRALVGVPLPRAADGRLVLAVLPSPHRHRVHIPPVQADPRLDQASASQLGSSRLVDLDRDRCLCPTTARSPAGHRPPQALGGAGRAEQAHARPRSQRVQEPAREDRLPG